MTVCGLISTTTAQDAPRKIWEYIMLTPNNTHLKVLGENMRKHNQKYHSEGPYKAFVFNVVTGDDVGKIVWQMGPINYSDLDSRPSENGHDDDWRDNILPYVKYQSDSEYWNTHLDVSLLDEMDTETVSHPILMVRFLNIADGQSYKVGGIMKQISATVKSIPNHSPWGAFDNQFLQGDRGRHLATVRYLKTWSELDGENNFKGYYEKVHGNNSWDAYQKDLSTTFSDTWDVILQYNAHMSGK